MFKYSSESTDDTINFATKFAKHLKQNDIIVLSRRFRLSAKQNL